MSEQKNPTEYDRVFVMFCNAGDGFKAVPREDIPDWLRDEDVIDKLLDGEHAQMANDPRVYRAVEIDRPRPVGERQRIFNPSKIILPDRAVVH
jgi:hypothetical protein